MFRCCQTTVNRAIRNHMGDDIDDDDAMIRNADLPADVSVMLGLKECEDDKASLSANQWRPWGPTRKAIVPALRPVPRMGTRKSPKASVGHCHSPHMLCIVLSNF